MEYICKECNKTFDIETEWKVNFVVCPNCGSDSIDYNVLDPIGNAIKSALDKKAENCQCCGKTCNCGGDK